MVDLLLTEEIFHFVEEAAGGGLVVNGHGLLELLDQLALRLGELAGDLDDNLHDHVAASGFVEMGNAFAAQLDLFAALRAFRNSQRDFAVDALDFNFVAEDGLGNADGDDAMEIVAMALKESVRLDGEYDVEITVLAVEAPGIALAGVANASAIFNAGGNFDLEFEVSGDAGFTTAGCAGVVDESAGTTACAAGARDGEEALLKTDLASATALTAGDGSLAAGTAGSMASGAGFATAELGFSFGAEDSRFKFDGQIVAQIVAALLTAAATSRRSCAATAAEHLAEEIAEDVADVDTAGEWRTSAKAAACANAGMTEAIISGAFIRIAEDLVGFACLFEFFFCGVVVGVSVGVVLHGEAAIGALQLLVAGCTINT